MAIDGMTSFLDDAPASEPATRQPKRERKARAGNKQGALNGAAAIDKHEGVMGRQVLACLVELEQRGGAGATAHELCIRLAYEPGGAPPQNSVSRRLTTLERKGWIVDTGALRMGGRGVAITVYASTAEGRGQLEGEPQS